MFDKPVTVIAAMARNRAIGREGRVPWDLPADWGRFRRLTMGCPVIVGQRTCAGFKRPLDGRTVIVLARKASRYRWETARWTARCSTRWKPPRSPRAVGSGSPEVRSPTGE